MTLYRSLVTGQLLSFDDLTECLACKTRGEITTEHRCSYTGRMIQVKHPCDACGTIGYVAGYSDDQPPHKVVAVTDPLMTESAS